MSNTNGSSAPQLFVRASSGLVKEFRLADVFVFNVLGYGLGLVLATTPAMMGKLYPAADIYAVLTVGVLLAICNGLTYGLFAAAMPRSGGDYVFIGRTLRPWIGFAASWGFTWSQFFGLGVYAGWSVSDALAPSLTIFGYTAGLPQFIDLGKQIGDKWWILSLGTLVLASVLLVSVLGTRVLKTFFAIAFAVAMVGTLVMLYVFMTTDHATFVARFNQFMQANSQMQNAYATIIQQAQAQGMTTSQSGGLWSAILALPMGYWVFIGFTYSVYVGGEVRQPQKSQVWGILGALVFGYVLYMLVMGRYYEVVGKDFNNAIALLADKNISPLPAGTSMVFFSGICTSSSVASLLMSVSNFIWFYMLVFIIAQISIRNLFAWSFDRLMPPGLTKLSRSRGTPWVASLVVVALGEFFLILHAFQLMAFVNYISMYSVCFLLCGVAAMVFPYRRRNFFDQAPDLVRMKILGVPLISIVGFVNVALFVVVLYSALTNSGLSGVSGWAPTVILIAIYALGVVVYFSVPFIAGLSNRARGDTRASSDLLYEELPPE